jgi:hypothetical protein
VNKEAEAAGQGKDEGTPGAALLPPEYYPHRLHCCTAAPAASKECLIRSVALAGERVRPFRQPDLAVDIVFNPPPGAFRDNTLVSANVHTLIRGAVARLSAADPSAVEVCPCWPHGAT